MANHAGRGSGPVVNHHDSQGAGIDYQTEPDVSAAEFIDLLHRSTLAERRPVNELDLIEMMLRNASLIVTARHDSKLVGVARSISDFVYCTYLSDLAVDEQWQGQGVGRRLIDETRNAAAPSTLILLAAPKAASYYPHIGMEPHDSCWLFRPEDDLPSTDRSE